MTRDTHFAEPTRHLVSRLIKLSIREAAQRVRDCRAVWCVGRVMLEIAKHRRGVAGWPLREAIAKSSQETGAVERRFRLLAAGPLRRKFLTGLIEFYRNRRRGHLF